jgi:hypothetical protein
MAQQLRGHEFKSQQPHGGSQPSVMRSDALFWSVRRQYLQSVLTYNKSLKKKKKALTILPEVPSSISSNCMVTHSYL